MGNSKFIKTSPLERPNFSLSESSILTHSQQKVNYVVDTTLLTNLDPTHLQYSSLYVFTIQAEWKTVWILISWLLLSKLIRICIVFKEVTSRLSMVWVKVL